MEECGKHIGVYRGSVESNEDPENMGRLKIRCSVLYGNAVPEHWAFPRGIPAGAGHGIFWIPVKGDPIYVSCENGDARFPLWEYGWFTKGNHPVDASPTVKVFLTPFGQRVQFNDDDKSIDITNQAGFHVKLRSDGIFFGKDADNLGKFMNDLLQLLVTTTVPTIYGASVFNNKALYEELKAKIPNFLKF